MISGPPLNNQDAANELLQSILDNPPASPVLVYFDPDVDGLISGKFFCDFLDSHGIPFDTYMNPNRQHGFLLSSRSVTSRVILSGDFQVTQDKFSDLVINHDATYLSSDHHENEIDTPVIRTSSSRGVLMNPQLKGEPQRAGEAYQSGAGVVLDILSHFDPSMNTPLNRALVGVTLLSDVRPIDNPRARVFLEELYNHPVEGYFKFLVDSIYDQSVDYGFGRPTLSRQFIDFKMSPFINSMIRFNLRQDAIDFILGKSRPKENYPQKQREFVSMIRREFPPKPLGEGYVLNYPLEGIPQEYRSFFGNFLGTLASKYSEDRSTIAMLTDSNGRVLRSSFRGPSDAPYREVLQELSGVECVGHSSAFGIHLETLTKDFLLAFRDSIPLAESKAPKSLAVPPIKISSLSSWVRKEGKEIGYENQFRTNSHKQYVDYTGPWSVQDETPSRRVFRAKGDVKIVTYDFDLTPDNSWIDPVYDRGSISLHLIPRRRDSTSSTTPKALSL